MYELDCQVKKESEETEVETSEEVETPELVLNNVVVLMPMGC